MRRPEPARKFAAEPADYQGKQRVTDSHEILGRSHPTTRSQERRALLDRGDVLEPQDLTIRTCLENDVSILLWLVVASHHAHHIRAPHIFECLRPAVRLAELFFFGRNMHAVIPRSIQEVVERQVVGAHAVEIRNEPYYIRAVAENVRFFKI